MFQPKPPLPADAVVLPSVDSHSALFTTEITRTSVSPNPPPLPLPPWSLLLNVRLTLPVKPLAGVKRRPSSAALTLASVPVNSIAALVLVPLRKLRPPVPDKVSVPALTDSVMRIAPAPMSTSPTLIALPLAAKNTSSTLRPVMLAAGRLLRGASLTALTSKPIVYAAETPPALSTTLNCRLL